MKKILALALALLMMATTVSLAACSKDDPEPSDEDDDGEYEYNYGDDTSKDTSEESGTSGKNTNKDNDDDDDGDDNSKGEWIEKNDKICVGMNSVVLREGPGKNYEQVATVNSGKILDRIGTNGNWHKVKYNGEECYISSALVTLDVEDFEFEAVEEKALNVISGYTVNLRTTPFYSEDYQEANMGYSGFSATETDSAGESLKLIAVSKSKDWYKVSFTGTYGSKTYENEIFYLAASNAKYVSGLDGSSSSGGNGTTLG